MAAFKSYPDKKAPNGAICKWAQDITRLQKLWQARRATNAKEYFDYRDFYFCEIDHASTPKPASLGQAAN